MRLICPNCGAQYEVDARVIPDTGRDVQCSNCGHTWFQNPEHMDSELAEELGYELSHDEDAAEDSPEAAPDMPDFDTVPEDIEPGNDAAPDPGPHEHQDDIQDAVSELTRAETAPEAELEPARFETVEDTPPAAAPEGDDFDVEDDAEEHAPEMAPPGSALKDSVRDILRAEVEFDQSMRQTDSETLETQPDLGLEEPAPDAAKKSLRDRMARLRGLDPADPGIVAGGVAAASGKRRDLLPDIEEINSTLSAASERDEDGSVPDEDTRRTRAERSGFRSVFLALVLTAVVLVVLYLLAPVIAAKVPALAGVMESYIILANGFRGWLDQLLSSASTRLTALLGQISGS